jgi:hypothetical protein
MVIAPALSAMRRNLYRPKGYAAKCSVLIRGRWSLLVSRWREQRFLRPKAKGIGSFSAYYVADGDDTASLLFSVK